MPSTGTLYYTRSTKPYTTTLLCNQTGTSASYDFEGMAAIIHKMFITGMNFDVTGNGIETYIDIAPTGGGAKEICFLYSFCANAPIATDIQNGWFHALNLQNIECSPSTTIEMEIFTLSSSCEVTCALFWSPLRKVV